MIAAASLGVVALFVVATALPAWAHHPVLSGQTVCSDGDHLITWSIGNSEPAKVMHIETATAAIGAQTFAVTGYTADVAGGSSTSATTIVPGGTTGDIVLTVHATWLDNIQSTQSTTVHLKDQCTPNSTTTSTTGSTSTSASSTSTTASTTTTTEAPTSTTTSTTEAPTSTTTESTTTTASTTSTTESTTTTSTSSTTTSTTESTTTTSTAPTTSTTIDSSTTFESSTTAPTSTTIAPTTSSSTPVNTEGSTESTTSTTGSPTVTVAAPPPGALPFTGGSNTGPILGVFSLGAGLTALALARRRNQPRDS